MTTPTVGRRTFLQAAALSVTAPTALAQTANLDALSPAELLPLARAEGKVTIYSFTSRIAQVEKAFETAYPGIDVVPFDMSSTQQIARLRAEQQAGVRNADVAYLSDAPVVYGDLLQRGFLERYVPAAFAARVPAEFQTPLLAQRLSTKVLMYNEREHPNGSPVKNLWDLAEPRWRGKAVTVDPSVRGDYLDLYTEIALRHDDMAKAYAAKYNRNIQISSGVRTAGEEWLRAFFANRPVMVANTDLANDAVGKTGQTNGPVGFSTYSDRRDNQRKGWALQIANDTAPSAGIVFPANLGIVKGARNSAAARLLIHFMMGDDTPAGGPAFAPFYVPGDYATRRDIAPHPDAVPLDKLNAWRIDPVRTFAARKRIADLILSLQ